MAFVIVNSINNNYVRTTPKKNSWTPLLKNATKFMTSDKAHNFLTHNFRSAFPDVAESDAKVIDVSDIAGDFCQENICFTDATARETFLDMMSFFEEAAEKTKRYAALSRYYGGVVKRCDLETLDMLHAIEFTNENVVNGFKRYKQMQIIRQRRREAKDSLEYTSLLLSTGLLECMQDLTQCVSELKNFEETREYKPRTAIGLFDDPEG